MVVVVLVVSVFSLTGCGADLPTSNTNVERYAVGGRVEGDFQGKLVLLLNATERLVVTEAGPFAFTTRLTAGADYAVTAAAVPSDAEISWVDAEGTVSREGTQVVVNLAATYPVGGTVGGLVGEIVLEQGTEQITLDANQRFQFPSQLTAGQHYDVRIVRAPEHQLVTIAGSTGIIDPAQPTAIAIHCESTFTVGGSVTGLVGTVTLEATGGSFGSQGETLSVDRDGTFTFATRLRQGESFEIQVVAESIGQNITISHSSATIHDANFSAALVHCEDKQWTHPLTNDTSISSALRYASAPQAALSSSSGQAIVAWQQSDGMREQVFLSERNERGEWSHPTDLDDNISPNFEHAYRPQVAINAIGDALIVWQQLDGRRFGVFMSERVGGIWTHPASLRSAISRPESNAFDPQVAISADGSAIIAWQQSNGTNAQVFASYRDHAGGWTHPANIGDHLSLPNTDASEPRVVVAGDQNALLIWRQSDGSSDRVFHSQRYAGTWSHPTDLQDHFGVGDTDASSASVALGVSGHAIVAWQQSDGSSERILFSERPDWLSPWSEPASMAAAISPSQTSAFSPSVAVAPTGDAMITWYQFNGSTNQIYISVHDPELSIWDHPTSLMSHISLPGSSADQPQVKLDSAGNAFLSWNQSDASTPSAPTQIYLSQRIHGSWTHPIGFAEHVSPGGLPTLEPRLAIGPRGDGLLVWRQFDGIADRVLLSERR